MDSLTSKRKVERIFAHEILYGGNSYKMHVAELDTVTGHVILYPFSGEIHSTVFISGCVLLLPCDYAPHQP